MKIFLDTSVLIDLLDKDPSATSKVSSLRNLTSFYTSTLNIYEALRGILVFEGKKRDFPLNSLGTLITNISVLDLDMEGAKSAALTYAELRKAGTPINEPDYLVAGIAISNGIFSIMTKNARHFEKVKKLKVIPY